MLIVRAPVLTSWRLNAKALRNSLGTVRTEARLTMMSEQRCKSHGFQSFQTGAHVLGGYASRSKILKPLTLCTAAMRKPASTPLQDLSVGGRWSCLILRFSVLNFHKKNYGGPFHITLVFGQAFCVGITEMKRQDFSNLLDQKPLRAVPVVKVWGLGLRPKTSCGKLMCCYYQPLQDFCRFKDPLSNNPHPTPLIMHVVQFILQMLIAGGWI